MSQKGTGMGLSVLAGLVVAGVVGIALEIPAIPFGSTIGAFVGGFVAAWLLYSRRGRALIAGLIVGIFSFPVELLIFIGLISSGLYIPPPAPEIPESVLFAALALSLIIQVIGGTVGGLLGGMVHYPPADAHVGTRPYVPPPLPSSERYCVQCGAGLAGQASVCPACGAKQPI